MSGVIVPGARQKDDLLTTVMKGLSIARDVYGIKTASDQSERADEEHAQQKKDKDFAARGGISPVKKTEMEKTHKFSDQQTPDSTQVFIGTPDNNSPLYASVIDKQKTPLQKAVLWKAETTKEGKKVTQVHYNDNTDEFVAAAPETPKEPKEDKTASNAQDLRKEYNAHPVTRDTGALASAYKKVRGAAEVKTPTGPSDMSLVYGMMKMLDPGTGVKEGEYASAEDTRSIDQNIVALYNKARSGQKLDAGQRQAFLDEAERLLGSQLELQSEQDRRYSGLAAAWKLDPAQIIDPTFESLRKRPVSQRAPSPVSGDANAAPAGAPVGPPPAGSIIRNKKTGQLSKVGPNGELIPIDEESQPATPPQGP